MKSNSVTSFLVSVLIFFTISTGGFLLPFTYLQNADLFKPSLAANAQCLSARLSSHSFNFIKYPNISVDGLLTAYYNLSQQTRSF